MRKIYALSAAMCVFAMAVFMFSGCATIFKGTANSVDFSSAPSGAKVYVNGTLKGTTPVRLKLESKKVYNIEFKKEGFKTKTFTITNHVGVGWIILDVFGGLVPIIIDAATGAWYSLDQENVNAILEEQQ